VDAQVFDDFQKRIDDLRIELRAPFYAQIDRHFACGNAFRQGRLCVGEL